ncbi:MAG: cobyrinate a,c-diamide synthase [Firmicutes bacterium]|nr:cobyrinate a,c-diamide synthase [Bacillota bacterium]
MNRIMVAGEASNVGKTTISLGIMAALAKRKLKVQPFKVGPDYIDPSFHRFVSNNISFNLDSWLLSENTIKYLFRRNAKDKDISVIEGVMGLYDGFGVDKDNGSSAHMSKILKTPVILVIDAKAMASSVAAKVLGYKLYDKEVNIRGIILNKVSSKGHYDLLKEVIEKDVKIPCVGYLPFNKEETLNSRHLGLVPAEEVDNLKLKVNSLVKKIEKYIDLEKIIKISKSKEKIGKINNPIKLKGYGDGLKIAVAKDEAFSFYYEDNLKLLNEIGVKLKTFSPLKDESLPKDIDGLYIGGGFPEVFSKELEKNKKFRGNLKKRLDDGLPAYAECGGLMYLTKGIKKLDGTFYKTVGYFDTISLMTKALQRFGYVDVKVPNWEIKIKAHEFHHSKLKENNKLNYIYTVYKKRNGKINKEWKCGLSKKNVLAAYPHIHFYSNPVYLKKLIDKCREYKLGDGKIENE